MDDELQKKLAEILTRSRKDTAPIQEIADYDYTVQILRAFQEAGWMDASGFLEISRSLARQAEILLKMTEQITSPLFEIREPHAQCTDLRS